jgi:hypothetical protein
MFGMIGGAAGALIVVVWWLVLSRAPWSERIGAIVLAAAAMAAAFRVIHVSIQNGMMGYMFLMYAIQGVTLALVVWALTCGRLSGGLRRASLVAAILIGCGAWTLLRTDGLLPAARSGRGDGRRPPKSACWPKRARPVIPLRSGRRRRPLKSRHQAPGRVFEAPIATA